MKVTVTFALALFVFFCRYWEYAKKAKVFNVANV